MSTLEPITRNEKFYKAIADNDSTGLPEPKTREELYLNAIATGNKEGLPEPVTRQEIFLREIAENGGGGDVTIEPLTVTENGTYSEEGKAYKPVVVDVATPENAYLLKSATDGDIVTFTDGSNLPMPSLKVGIEPIQEGSGDPSPTNVRPISGWDEVNVVRAGKNQAKKTIHGYINYQNSKMVIDNDSESVVFYAVAGKTYTVSSSVTMNRSMLGLADTDNIDNQYQLLDIIELNNEVVTWTATWTGWTVWYKCTSAQSGFANSVQVELGSEATTYEPYNGTTITIDLDGTRYGGTLDVVNGVLTVDWLKCDISQTIITKSVSGLFQTNSLTADIKKPISTLSASGYIKSSLFSEIGSTYIIGSQGTNPSPDGVMALSSTGMLYFNYLATSDIDVFKRAMENIDFIYELATPLTIQLTPTAVKSLLGSNNVWCDTGKIEELEYFSKEI